MAAGAHATSGDAYPRMNAYLARLPEAERSYPQCQIRSGLLNLSLEHHPFPVRSDTPAWLRELVSVRRPATVLVSNVQCNAWVLAMLDTVFAGQVERYLQFNYEVNLKIGAHPMYSLMYKLISPGLIMRTMSMGFKQLMPGVHVAIRAQEKSALVMLSYPPHLYEEVLAQGWAAAFRAMVECAGGTAPRVELIEAQSSQTQFRASWM